MHFKFAYVGTIKKCNDSVNISSRGLRNRMRKAGEIGDLDKTHAKQLIIL